MDKWLRIKAAKGRFCTRIDTKIGGVTIFLVVARKVQLLFFVGKDGTIPLHLLFAEVLLRDINMLQYFYRF